MARWIAGLDGCRKAWACVLLDLDDPSRHQAARFGSVADILDGPEAPIAVGVDVPIGLPERTTTGGRPADIAARRLLGRGGSSVFPVPPRAAVHAGDYDAVRRLALANSDPPKSVSRQTYEILPFIREVDGMLCARPALRARVHEVHPEVAFFRLNGDRALGHRKREAAGQALRRALLLQAGLPEALVMSRPPRDVGLDDHIDAMVGLVVARDIVLGAATPIPDPPERDARGLPIAIWSPARPGDR